MTNFIYISIYDEIRLFKDTIDEIISAHSEGINLKSKEERRKLRANIFNEVKTTMMKVWKEEIDDEELDDCICNRIYKYAGYYMPPEFD